MLLEKKYKDYSVSFWIGLFFLFILTIFELWKILILNSGFFVYTLDDPYIHLALAENISKGHYGVNLTEYSSPSSSILWPFLLAPFSNTSFFNYVPLIINILSSIGCIYLFWSILTISVSIESRTQKLIVVSFFLIFLIIGSNLINLIFMGMEHTLQVFSCILIIQGLILAIEKDKISTGLKIGILLAPLVRYESGIISLAAIVYLFFTGHRKTSVILAVTLFLIIGSFSIFLLNIGQSLLPTSVLAKSNIARKLGLGTILENIKNHLNNPRAILLAIGMIFLISISFLHYRTKKEKLFAGTIAFAIICHFILGKFGWFNRYEIYIWISAIIVLIFLNIKLLKLFKSWQLIFIAGMITFFLSIPFIQNIISTPTGSNNIYEQQYQMHRFAVEFYNKPVAVNDIGYVTYRNKNYVLDLWGLGSKKALEFQLNKNGQWMNQLCEVSNVKLAMIYGDWFNEIPEEWIKLGELFISKELITVSRQKVDFYVLDKSIIQDVRSLLIIYQKTLPEGVLLKIY